MSKVLNISVSKSEVFDEVGRITEYVGKKAAVEGAYDTIATIKANDSMLDRFWSEGCDNLDNTFKHFVLNEPERGDVYELECIMTNNWNDSLEGGINEDSKNYLIQYIVAKWMRFVKADDEQKYLADAVAIVESIGSKLLSRVRPKRVFHRHNDCM